MDEFGQWHADKYKAVARFTRGEKPRFSSNIAEELTAGYGELDEHGFWQYQLPYWHMSLVLYRSKTLQELTALPNL